jgi:hypothetical protein
MCQRLYNRGCGQVGDNETDNLGDTAAVVDVVVCCLNIKKESR